jgi:beta-apo-4'-carotenal oxygenase
MAEIIWTQNDIIFCNSNLHKWAKDSAAEDAPLMAKFMSPKIRKEPYGVGLVIGAFNFPVQLSLGPMIGAIVAGNACVLKPSEVCPNVAIVLQKIVESSLDPSAYAVVQGGIPETTELLNQKWDKIFYTGNGVVGTIIAKKAAETLTPVVLELGGMNPAIISKNADPQLAARRLTWSKIHNAGQVCVSQNYVLIEKEVFPAFIEAFKATLKEFFPKGAKESPDFGRIVNERHFNRIKGLLEKSQGKILIGGSTDIKERYIEPTVVEVTSLDDELMKDEIFGPVMPIMVVPSLENAIAIANKHSGTPLGLYAFSKEKAEIDKILNETQSGGASINDGFTHASFGTIPFGGVGSSGSGAYRGKASFNTWTHERTITSTPSWVESFLSLRYPPYAGKTSQYRSASALKPNFDRQGRAKAGWVWYILTLGGGSAVSGATRLVLLALGMHNKSSGNTSYIPVLLDCGVIFVLRSRLGSAASLAII